MKTTEVAAAVILRPDGSFLLGQRPQGRPWAGWWEFPGGKIEAGESPRAALVRELREELGLTVLRADPWIVRSHRYESAQVRLNFFRVPQWQGELTDVEHDAIVWQPPGAPAVEPMLPANAPVLAALALPDFIAITHAAAAGVAAQVEALEAALAAGLRAVILREPLLAPDARAAFAYRAAALCRARGARLIVNGDDALARACNAGGLHLPAGMLHGARERPQFELVGASCHTRAELEHAAALGLDYALLGPVQSTTTHPDAAPLGWARFAQLAAGLPLPVYALGGLARADLDTACAHGAHGIAAIRAAWSDAAA